MLSTSGITCLASMLAKASLLMCPKPNVSQVPVGWNMKMIRPLAFVVLVGIPCFLSWCCMVWWMAWMMVLYVSSGRLGSSSCVVGMCYQPRML